MNKLIYKVLKRYYNKFGGPDLEYQIENFKIWLPFSHKLPEYQRLFKNYDKKLKVILKNLEKFKKTSVIIDIGANVGDTAAVFRSYSSARIVCIEGEEFFLNYLRRNSKIIPNIEIVETFVIGNNGKLMGEVRRTDGTAKIITSSVFENGVQMLNTKPLMKILKENEIDPEMIDLIKIDTDGFDFNILQGNRDIIEMVKPNLFFEYDISFNKEDFEASVKVISILENLGYKFIVYDNFGNLLDFVTKECTMKFTRFNQYLMSCRVNGGGIYYFDLFATVDQSLADKIIQYDTLSEEIF